MEAQSKKQIPDYLPALVTSPRELPFCEICHRPVDSVEWEKPHSTVFSWDGLAELIETGEIIVTVKCHGETWRWSNFGGVYP